MARTIFTRRRYRRKRWAYCRGVTNRIIDIVVDIKHPTWGFARARAYRLWVVSSRKRWITFGNPGSDHYAGNRNADAVDFRLVDDYETRDRVMRRLGVTGPINDYGSYMVRHNRMSFRVQPIAQQHGTGPHLHMGVKRL